MRTIDIQSYQHSMILTNLNRIGRAKPVGPVKANETMQWVRTFGGNVIYIGLILRSGARL